MLLILKWIGNEFEANIFSLITIHFRSLDSKKKIGKWQKIQSTFQLTSLFLFCHWNCPKQNKNKRVFHSQSTKSTCQIWALLYHEFHRICWFFFVSHLMLVKWKAIIWLFDTHCRFNNTEKNDFQSVVFPRYLQTKAGKKREQQQHP